MRKPMIAACVLLALVAPALAQTTVQHVANHVSCWRDAYNASPSYCWLGNWPNASADGVLADFDRTALRNAINSTVTASGGWDAKITVTQINWGTPPNPPIIPDLGPIVAAVDVDSTNFVWLSSYAYNAGAGSWRFNNSNYASFAQAVAAGVTAGKSFVADSPTWQSFWNTALAAPCYDIIIDMPESLVAQYVANTAAEGFFVGAKKASSGAGPVVVYGNDQWGKTADIRVTISAPPTTSPWLNASVLVVDEMIGLDSPSKSVNVTVTNAGSGTIAWTATEAVDVPWISLANGSGAAGGTFSVNLNMAGQTPGSYTATILVSAPGAANGPVQIPVKVNLVAASQPQIQLSKTALNFSAIPGQAAPAAQNVTVNNSAFGTLAWTAAESPDVAWLTVLPSTGGSGASFSVVANHAGLAMGVYTTNITVTDPNALNSPQTVVVKLVVREQDANITKANSYDDAWEDGASGWVGAMWHARLNATGKTAGFVTLLGDSITYANPFSQWPRYGSGKNALDTTICNWMKAGTWGSGGNNSANGWYLAAWDARSGGSYTARSGIRADQYLAGTYSLPSLDLMFDPAAGPNPDGKKYTDANIAVILLGTNDASSNRATSAYIADITTICNKLLAQKVIPVLTTLPPKVNDQTDVQNYNAALRSFAASKGLPLIDYYEECVRRRPDDTWQNTLISGDGVHPSASGGAYGSASVDPYASSGAALSEVGYLLRSWLTVQKIAEVKAKVIDRRTGDVDGDGHSDVVDLLTLAATWPLSLGEPNYDQRCDFNGDNAIDVQDLITLAENFGDF